MRKTKIVKIPAQEARTDEVSVCIVCDICKAESPNQEDWSTERSDMDETTVVVSVKNRSGVSGYGFTEKHFFDICPKCFWDKLVPFLKEQGAEPQVRKTNW